MASVSRNSFTLGREGLPGHGTAGSPNALALCRRDRQGRTLLLLVALSSAAHVCGQDNAGGDAVADEFPPRVLARLLEDEALTPPCTHHVDIELQSFDPADGYLELWAGATLLRRVLDPPPVEIYSVYNGAFSCQPPQPSCAGMHASAVVCALWRGCLTWQRSC
jgi:hypothetical protein